MTTREHTAAAIIVAGCIAAYAAIVAVLVIGGAG